jgi:hypothetical protein
VIPAGLPSRRPLRRLVVSRHVGEGVLMACRPEGQGRSDVSAKGMDNL